MITIAKHYFKKQTSYIAADFLSLERDHNGDYWTQSGGLYTPHQSPLDAMTAWQALLEHHRDDLQFID